jgi:hypothetical protein
MISIHVCQEARDAYYMKNYPGWFATVGKVLIKRQDGTFIVVTAEEADQMQKKGLLSFEIPKTMGGKIVDHTQKPILVLKQ